MKPDDFKSTCPKEDNTSSPIIFQNPYSNELMDVQPLVAYLHKYYDDDPKKLAEAMDNEIQIMVETFTCETNSVNIKNFIGHMFERRNLAKNMSDGSQADKRLSCAQGKIV